MVWLHEMKQNICRVIHVRVHSYILTAHYVKVLFKKDLKTLS